jgi:hypothetical protein
MPNCSFAAGALLIPVKSFQYFWAIQHGFDSFPSSTNAVKAREPTSQQQFDKQYDLQFATR